MGNRESWHAVTVASIAVATCLSIYGCGRDHSGLTDPVSCPSNATSAPLAGSTPAASSDPAMSSDGPASSGSPPASEPVNQFDSDTQVGAAGKGDEPGDAAGDSSEPVSTADAGDALLDNLVPSIAGSPTAIAPLPCR